MVLSTAQFITVEAHGRKIVYFTVAKKQRGISKMV